MEGEVRISNIVVYICSLNVWFWLWLRSRHLPPHSFGLCRYASGHWWCVVIADIWVVAGTCASSCLITQLQHTCEVNSSEQMLFSCIAFTECASWKKCYWNFCYKILPCRRTVYRIVSTFWITNSVPDKSGILKLVFMIWDIIFVKEGM
jgi:hypothetical protein